MQRFPLTADRNSPIVSNPLPKPPVTFHQTIPMPLGPTFPQIANSLENNPSPFIAARRLPSVPSIARLRPSICAAWPRMRPTEACFRDATEPDFTLAEVMEQQPRRGFGGMEVLDGRRAGPLNGMGIAIDCRTSSYVRGLKLTTTTTTTTPCNRLLHVCWVAFIFGG